MSRIAIQYWKVSNILLRNNNLGTLVKGLPCHSFERAYVRLHAVSSELMTNYIRLTNASHSVGRLLNTTAGLKYNLVIVQFTTTRRTFFFLLMFSTDRGETSRKVLRKSYPQRSHNL